MDQVLARGSGERIGERGLFPLRDALAQRRRALVQRAGEPVGDVIRQ